MASYIQDEELFCFTYGDGVADVDISAKLAFHKKHGKLSTVVALNPPGRYGALERSCNQVTGFIEKPRGDGGLINGGFFVLSPKVLSLIDSDQTTWESEPLGQLASKGELMAFEHNGFWQPMDTLREKNLLEKIFEEKANQNQLYHHANRRNNERTTDAQFQVSGYQKRNEK